MHVEYIQHIARSTSASTSGYCHRSGGSHSVVFICALTHCNETMHAMCTGANDVLGDHQRTHATDNMHALCLILSGGQESVPVTLEA